MKRRRGASLLFDSRGASLVEYVVVVGCVALVALGGYRTFGSSVLGKSEAQAKCVETFDCPEGTVAAAVPGPGADPNAIVAKGGPPGFGDVPGGKDATYQQIPGQPTITGNGDGNAIHPNDVSQGQLGDCYLVAGLAEIALRNPDVIKNAIRDNGDGSYTVTFWEKAAWYNPFDSGYHKVEIRVTNDFPAKDGNPVFAQPGDISGDQRELWPMILEKAYAQYHGSYDSIGGGDNSTGIFSLLTGKDANLDGGRNFQEWFGWGVEFNTVADAWERGDGMTVGTSGNHDLPLFKDGTLVNDHVYFVTNVDRDKQTVTVRNPWGWSNAEVTLSFEDFKKHYTGMSTVPLK